MAAAALAALVLAPATVQAATPAGTVITNVANIQYAKDGIVRATSSNRVDVRVDELIKFTVKPTQSTCAAPKGMTVISFRITNLGNGPENFIPRRPEVVQGGNFTVTGIYADTNGDGCFEPGVDQPIPPGSPTPRIGAGDSIVVFVVGTGGTGPIRVRLLFVPGTDDDGTGEGGGSVVIGGGDGTDNSGGNTGDGTGEPSGPADPMTATLVKSQSVEDPDGGVVPRHGAIVTYTIEGRFAGTGTATNAVIADSIPAGTVYIPGSLTLDGKAVSDGGGDVAGDFNGQRVSVRLGDVASPAVRTVAFQVRIN